MPRRLPVPEELAHLIEKREESDRRSKERRGTASAGQGDSTAVPSERRKSTDRRKSARRREG